MYGTNNIKNKMNDTDRFLKVFPNIPIPERQNAIYVDSQYGPLS